MTVLDAIRGAVAKPVPMSTVKHLGALSGAEYIETGGREYVLQPGSSDAQDGYAVGPGRILLSEPRYTEDNGRQLETGKRFRLAIAVDRGTFARLEAERAARAERKVAARPVDVLFQHRLFQHRPERVIGSSGTAALVEGKPSVRGPAAIIERLRSKSITLELVAGRLLVRAPGGRATVDEVEAIQAAERLLIAHLEGTPLTCEMPHKGTPPPAVTLVALALAACEECAA